MRCPDPSARLLITNLKGNPMSVVIFQTEHAIFNFDRRDLPHQLNFLAIDYDSQEKTELLKLITTTRNEKILIPENHIWFEFIVPELIDAGKGSVLCKTCDRIYDAIRLKSIEIGCGRSPIDIRREKKGLIKRLFTKKRKPPEMFGGWKIQCPESHDLTSITWKTF